MILEDYNFLNMDFQILLRQNDIKVVFLVATRSVTLTIYVLTATSMTAIIRTTSSDVDQAIELFFSRHTFIGCVVACNIGIAVQFKIIEQSLLVFTYL
jgi:adenosylmethionine-8-amino-7-oxononanoate aminotransferase